MHKKMRFRVHVHPFLAVRAQIFGFFVHEWSKMTVYTSIKRLTSSIKGHRNVFNILFLKRQY